jgi:hypothetical protein|tara:strand:- start:521 stop:751 length:231 start_codon:yes stop_codon:yes gene_type:complete
MLKVVTLKAKKVISIKEFNEQVDEDAMKKALVESDRAIWSAREENDQVYVALMQDDRLLRYMNDTGWYTPKRSIYE